MNGGHIYTSFGVYYKLISEVNMGKISILPVAIDLLAHLVGSWGCMSEKWLAFGVYFVATRSDKCLPLVPL